MQFEIPITVDPFDDEGCHITLNAIFNDTYEGVMIIDTGASKTVFDSIIFKEIADFMAPDPLIYSNGISTEDITEEEKNEVITLGINPGKISFYFGSIRAFQLNDFCVNDLQTTFIDLSNVNETYERLGKFKVWGLLGSDFLLKYKAIIDYEKLVLILNTESIG